MEHTKHSDIRIVPYSEQNKEPIIRLILHIQNEEAKIDLSLDEQPDLSDISACYLQSGGGFWTALTPAGDVVGTIGLMQGADHYGILKKFFVRADYRGTGLGLSLYRVLYAFAQENGIRGRPSLYSRTGSMSGQVSGASPQRICPFPIPIRTEIRTSTCSECPTRRNLNMKKVFLRIASLLTGAVFVGIGIYRGEVSEVLTKAVRICLECIGIG